MNRERRESHWIRENWTAVYGGSGNAHKVAVLEEGMSYKPISLPPEDSQFLSTREFGVEEICRIFRVPPHMVQDLKRATFSNIEHQSIDFVVYTLDPWLRRIEKAIVKDVLLGDEQDEFFSQFNVDGLLRSDYKSRMEGYSIGRTNGWMSANDIWTSILTLPVMTRPCIHRLRAHRSGTAS